MVDVKNRAKAAKLILDFVEGRITNDEFDEQYPHRSSDQALQNIWRYLWLFWDDRESHTLRGEHQLSAPQRVLCEHCVTFLQTEIEYTGPTISVGLSSGLRRIGREAIALLQRHPNKDDLDSSWWPFVSEEQYCQHRPKEAP
jgi:hypothetical protein